MTNELFLLPAPKKPLTPSEARAWLEEWRSDWTVTAGTGYYSDDAAVRDSFAILALDVSTYTGGCIAAAFSGKPVTFKCYQGPEGRDFADHAEDLARVVTGRSLVDGTGGFEDCPVHLADELAERTRLLAERETEARA